jgi:polyisoprenoid-binding protein YceI
MMIISYYLSREVYMRLRLIPLAVVAVLTCLSGVSAAEKFMIDPVHSYVGFSVRHMVISNVKGDFTDFKGTITFDKNDVTKSSASVTINAASINTNNNTRDDHLRSADFFDVAQFPEIAFTSTSVEKSGDGFVLHGILTMRGIKKEVAIPFQMLGTAKGPQGETRIGFEGQTTINRKDFGVSWNKTLDGGGLVVGDDVRIDLQIEAIMQS